MNKEEKYKIKCINYFADKDFIVYGNLCTPKKYIPITFVTDENNFKIKIEIDKWEELYKNRGIVLNLIQLEYRIHDTTLTYKDEIRIDNNRVYEEIKKVGEWYGRNRRNKNKSNT